MRILIATLLLATSTSSGSVGVVFVHIPPGYEVILDGKSAGLSTAKDEGKVIKGVAAGVHSVIVRTSDGREAKASVSVAKGQTTDVNISPLGFRRLNKGVEDESGAVKLTSVPDGAVAQINGLTRENAGGSEITFDPIPAGRYVLTLTTAGGAKKITSDVDVPRASLVTIDARGGALKFVDAKLRPRKLLINEANDSLTRLDVPGHWKTAIRSALPATVSILDAISVGDGVKVRLKVPSDRMGHALFSSLQSSSSFESVVMTSYPRKEQIGWVIDLAFYFAVTR